VPSQSCACWLLPCMGSRSGGRCSRRSLVAGESTSAVRRCLCRRDGLNRIGGKCRAACVRRGESGGKRRSLLTAAANVGTAE
jgi:hypothetical protein